MSYSEILQRRINNLLRNQAFGEALDLSDELKSHKGLNLVSQGYVLESLLGLRRLADAKKLGDLLCEQYPDSARVYYLNGKVHFYLKKYKQAEILLRKHVDLYTSFFGSFWLAKSLISTRKDDEALSILNRLDRNHPFVLQELGWLYERRNQIDTALGYYKKILVQQPENAFIHNKTEELEARQISSTDFLEEMETLEALDEEIPDHLLKSYVEKNLELGDQEKMRRFYKTNKSRFTPKLCKEIGWTCYHAKCYDLAFDLFLVYFHTDQTGTILNNSMQKAAVMSGKVMPLIQVYRQYTQQNRSLFGRIKKLQKHLECGSSLPRGGLHS